MCLTDWCKYLLMKLGTLICRRGFVEQHLRIPSDCSVSCVCSRALIVPILLGDACDKILPYHSMRLEQILALVGNSFWQRVFCALLWCMAAAPPEERTSVSAGCMGCPAQQIPTFPMHSKWDQSLQASVYKITVV